MNVFDASALLAVLFDEPGADRVHELLEQGEGVVSSVNYAEVMSKLFEQGVADGDALAAWHGLPVTIAPLDAPLALAAAGLRRATKALGLSLGDRCCLALAHSAGGSAVTADRSWKKVKGASVVLVR